MVKLRLSLLTSNTSHTTLPKKQRIVVNNDNNMDNYKEDDIQKDTCFELITPLQIYTFSLLFDDTTDQKDETGDFYTKTLALEIHLTISLSSQPCDNDNNMWKHQIILLDLS